jgi:hypothetical protein
MNPLLITVSCGIIAQLGPIKTYKQHTVEGVFACNDETNGRVSVKLPPEQGQFLARNRDQIIDHFDFDLRPESKGAWLWKSTIQKDTQTGITIPVSTRLPVILSSASGQTGVQTAEIHITQIKNPASVTYTCNGETKTTVKGVGSCLGLFHALSVITASVPQNKPAIIRHTGCVEKAGVEPQAEFDLDDCIHGVRILTADGETEARIVYRAKRGDVGMLPPPSRVDGKWLRPWQATVWQEEGSCAFAWSKESFSWRCL